MPVNRRASPPSKSAHASHASEQSVASKRRASSVAGQYVAGTTAGKRRASGKAEQDVVLTDDSGNEIHVELKVRSTRPSDPLEVLKDLFGEELRSLLGDALPDERAVRRAARVAFAEQAWRQRLGDLLDTGDVMELLGVSRQRVSRLVREHRLVALSQEGRFRFPAWQFALDRRQDRERITSAHSVLVETGRLSPWSAASWCITEHPELDGEDPVSWLKDGRDGDVVKQVAARDAARLAQ